MRWRYLPSYSPPSVSMSTRISLERTPRFFIGNFLIKRLSTYFFSPSQDADRTGFSNGPAIATDGERDSTAANPGNRVHDTFVPGESPVTGKRFKTPC